MVDRGGMVDRRGMVGRSSLVGSGFWVGCFTFVFHISNVALGASSVRNNLDTTVGKVDTVFSSGVIVITALLLAENWSVSGIVYSIFVVVHWGKDGLIIRSRGGVVGSWGSSGSGNSQEAGGKSKLKTNLEVQPLNFAGQCFAFLLFQAVRSF